jgi:DNA-binding GntR family transcriptional regulator
VPTTDRPRSVFRYVGTRLSEDSTGGALGVFCNTLREAFRLLTHERLLVHELNRGVFVRVLTVEDVEDVYRTRALVECAVVRGLGEPPYDLDGLTEAVESGRRVKVTGKEWVRPISTSTGSWSPSPAASAPTN